MTRPLLTRWDDDKPREECGVFGIFDNEEAAALTVLGLVGDHFSSEAVIAGLPGRAAIGHVRYSTAGAPLLRNVQPLFADFAFGGLALGHNGNLTNALVLRRQLVEQGCLFQSTSDTEVIVHLIARSSQPTVVERLIDALGQVQGAYALTASSADAIYGVRDPLGIRPLVIGELEGAPILASETCALDIMGARFVRDVEAGEVVIATTRGIESIKPFGTPPRRFCIFEYVYFARPDSVVEGQSVYETRKRIGAELAREAAAPADIVIPVPDSGVPAAIGYAQAANLPFELGLIRNHYVGRTFIEPSDRIRHLGVKLKHNANRGTVAGRRVVLVDDSIVRGTTSTKIVAMVRAAGAAEIHMRVASPPTTHSCFYGVDTPERSQLLAAANDLDAMARIIGVDSLAFLSLDGLYRAVGGAGRDPGQPQYCDACFSGDYPTALEDVGEGRAADQLSLMLEDA